MSEVFDDYTDLDFDDLDTLRDDIERVLDPGQYAVQLRAVQSYENTYEKDGVANTVKGLNFRFSTVDCDDPKDNGRTVFHRVVWGKDYFKLTVLGLAKAAGKKSITLNFEAAMLNEDEWINSLVGTPCDVILKVESWKDKNTGDDRQENRIAKFVD